MADKPANHYTSSHVSTPRWDPPNFAYSTPVNTNISSNPGHSSGVMGKQEGYGDVTIVRDTSIDFTGSNGGASAIFLPTAAVGSASFANGSAVSLADLATDTMYPFNITNVSASGHVLVFKR
jgi:hypothetical protein